MSTEKLVELATVTSKRAIKAAALAAARAAKRARDAEIDEKAKHARALDMQRALAEPADCGRGRRQRGQKRKSSVQDGRGCSKQKKAANSQKRRSSVPTELVDIDATSASSEETEDMMAEENAVPVMVDGHEEWVVDKITASKLIKVKNDSGEFDWVTKYEVHWIGGEVTWETYDMVCDCAAMDEFERNRA